MNIVCLAGNMTRNPEMRKTSSGKSVVSFSLAINEGRDKTEFVNCIAWEKTAELIESYVAKGDRLSLTGRLQTRKWDKDGETRYATEVIVTQFDFPPKKSSDSPKAQSRPQENFDELEDEIPF